MILENKKWYKRGLRDGVPIALGYFAVAFTLGIVAKHAGLTAVQTFLATALTNASAGGYAGFKIIEESAPYLDMALTIFVVNIRYFLMSCALSQKLSPKTSLMHRIFIGFDVTDEIFGISMAVKGELNPWYNYGAMTVSIPCWATGAALGVVMGNVLPQSLVNALSVGLYGMFLAIIIPSAKKNKIIAGIVAVSMILSFGFSRLPFLSSLSSGMRVIILTVIIAFAAAVLFPVKEEAENE
ncbi:MAG: AzlC family ABC transporter permease [Clostridia bacterium]|nr:AzlC family ABC transporter permease [Clostridia bacterium]